MPCIITTTVAPRNCPTFDTILLLCAGNPAPIRWSISWSAMCIWHITYSYTLGWLHYQFSKFLSNFYFANDRRWRHTLFDVTLTEKANAGLKQLPFNCGSVSPVYVHHLSVPSFILPSTRTQPARLNVHHRHLTAYKPTLALLSSHMFHGQRAVLLLLSFLFVVSAIVVCLCCLAAPWSSSGL